MMNINRYNLYKIFFLGFSTFCKNDKTEELRNFSPIFKLLVLDNFDEVTSFQHHTDGANIKNRRCFYFHK
jgi:hypothetical protein